MRFKFIKSLAINFYNTGGGHLKSKKYEQRALNNKNLVLKICSKYNINPKNILEVGYGKYPKCLEFLKETIKPKFICGVEKLKYKHNSKIFCFQDFSEIPANIKFDLIYTIDVFEHVKNPKKLNKLILEKSKPSTIIFHSIDLKSHYHSGSSINAFNHYFYKKNIWELMTSNRSSFTNRLRRHQWEELFQEYFFILDFESINHSLAKEILIKYQKLNKNDTISRVNFVLKPRFS